MKVLISIILGLAIVIAYSCIIGFIRSITVFFEEKKKKVAAETLKVIKETNELVDSYETTNNIITTIDFILDKEIGLRIYRISIDKGPYNITKLDKDIKDIADTVFKALNSAVIAKYANEYLINTDYIMSYITRQTTMKFSSAVTDFNRARIAQQIGGSK